MKRIFLSFAFFVFLLPSALAYEWYDSLDEALQVAKKQNRPMFVYLYHPNSLREDFRVWNSSLVKKYAKQFVAVQVNIESKPDFIENKHLNTFPTVLFYDQKGRELISMRLQETNININLHLRRSTPKRTLTRNGVAQRMNQVLEEIEEFSLVESQIENYKDSPRFLARYAQGLRDRGQFDKAEDLYTKLFKMKEQIDPPLYKTILVDYKNMFIFRGTLNFFSGEYDLAIDLMQRLIDRFPEDDEVPNANLILGMSLYEIGDKKRGETVLKTLSKKSEAGVYAVQAERYLKERAR